MLSDAVDHRVYKVFASQNAAISRIELFLGAKPQARFHVLLKSFSGNFLIWRKMPEHRVNVYDAGGLGTIDTPNQPTFYSYDTLNNLATVSQGVQTRSFV